MTTINLFGELVDVDPLATRRRRVLETRTKSGSYVVNPCLKLYGKGPEGKRCKACKHLLAKRRGRTWYKCELRAGTYHKTSPVSDHRANWPACGRFEPK